MSVEAKGLEAHWAARPLGEGRYAAALREDWYQGRGVYGGLVAALTTRAMRAELGDDWPARTVHVAFTSPATAGEVEIAVERLRVGRSVAVAAAKMIRDGELIASAQATFAKDRDVSFGFEAPAAPKLPPPGEVSDGPKALYIPDFCRYFEFRQAEGPTSFSGGEVARLAGWCRPRTPTPLSAELVLSLLDAWAPAALCRREGWAPAASIDLTADLPPRFGRTMLEDFAMYVAQSSFAHDGYADERASLYAPTGEWLGSTRQLIALFDP
ncbi:MAG: acyl-CoA thioesterase [Sandaracinaceae bacterium]